MQLVKIGVEPPAGRVGRSVGHCAGIGGGEPAIDFQRHLELHGHAVAAGHRALARSAGASLAGHIGTEAAPLERTVDQRPTRDGAGPLCHFSIGGARDHGALERHAHPLAGAAFQDDCSGKQKRI